PIIAVVVLIFVAIGVYGLYQKWVELERIGWNQDIYSLFQGSEEEIRAAAPELIEKLEGKPVEGFLVGSYCKWLYDQNRGDDRERALALIRETRARLPDDPLLIPYATQLTRAYEDEASFTLPALPEPEPPPEAGGGVEDAGAVPAAGSGGAAPPGGPAGNPPPGGTATPPQEGGEASQGADPAPEQPPTPEQPRGPGPLRPDDGGDGDR
ncbi:MAG: hypothetical protein ACE5GW_03255, partial [Planctomycetota bacterium]